MRLHEQQNPIRNRPAGQEKSLGSNLRQGYRSLFGFRSRIGLVATVLLAGTCIDVDGAVRESPSGLAGNSLTAEIDSISIIERWRDVFGWLYTWFTVSESGRTGVDNQDMLLCIDRYYQNGVPQGLSPEERFESHRRIVELLDLTDKRLDLDPVIKGDFMGMLQSALRDLE